METKSLIKPELKTIPTWMIEKNNNIIVKNSLFNRNNYLVKTLNELLNIMQNEVFSEKFVCLKGYLQVIDSRVKLLTILFYMLFCAITKNCVTLILLAFISFGFAKLSRLSMKDFFKRVWLIIPLFLLIISLPAATNLFVTSKPLFYIYRSFNVQILFIKLPNELYISYAGLNIIFKMALRVGVSVSFAYLLIMTTSWSCITKSLSVFKISTFIITLLNMSYRYIFILTKSASDMMIARFLRTIGESKNKHSRNFLANRISLLFIKSSFMSDEIYDAMRCRGFSGEVYSLKKFKIKKTDYFWILNNISLIFILIMGELLY